MNDKAINDVLELVLKNVIAELGNGKQEALPVKTSCEPIPIELSARHVHLSNDDAFALFGGPLTPVRELSQPAQFLCKERVRLIGPKGVMDNVAVLGPTRPNSQIEISKTDARSLGIDAPVRQSGDTKGTPGIILASTAGIVGVEEGVIIAARHIHMSPDEATRLGVADMDKVNVHLDTERPITLNDVLIRVNNDFRLSMHIDPDEGNSAGWNKKCLRSNSGLLVPYSGKPVIKNKKSESSFNINNLKLVSDSERRENFEALMLAYFPFTGVSRYFKTMICSGVESEL